MVVQGIKDQSKIRELMGDKEAREMGMNVKQEKGNKRRPGDGCPWDKGKDPGEIQERSIDLKGSVFRSVREE